MLLWEILPAVAEELNRGLLRIGEGALAACVDKSEIHGRCQCGDRGCGTFYTRPRSEWLGKPLRQVVPEVHRLLAIDIRDLEIVCIEFLGRSDVGAALDEHLGRVEKAIR